MKNSQKKNLVLSLTLFFYFFTSFSQEINFKEYNTSNGFSNDYIYDVEQDSMGYIWLGTSSGLIKLDNKGWQTYSFKEEGANNIFYDVNLLGKKVWLSGKKGLLTQLNNEKMDTLNTGYTQKIIKTVNLDDSRFIILTQSEGFAVYNKNTDSIIKYDFETFDIKRARNIKVIDGRIFICAQNGITVLKKKEVGGFSIDEQISTLRNVNDIVAYENRYVVATDGNGLFVFDNKEGKLKNQKSFLEGDARLEIPIKNLMVDNQQRIWVSTFGNGLIELSPKQNNFVFQVIQHKDFNGLELTYINKTFQDYEGFIWICTYGSGLVSISNDFIKHRTFSKGNSRFISSILWGNHGLLLAGKSTISFLAEDDSVSLVATIPTGEGRISYLTKYNEEEIFVGTSESGVFQLNLLTGKFTKIAYAEESLSQKVNSLYVNGNDLWIATFNGAFRYNMKTAKVTTYNTTNGIRHNLVNVIEKTSAGDIVLGYKSNRLFFVKEDDSTYETMLPSFNPNISITTLNDINGDLYIGSTGSGLFIKKADTILHYTKDQGLASNYVYSLQNYDGNSIFIVHEDNISWMNPKEGKIKSLDGRFGLLNEFQVRASASSDKDELFFGTDRGLLEFQPLGFLNRKVKPKLGFNNLMINDSIYEIDAQDIKLPNGKYKISMDFKGISFNQSNDIEYSYILDGFDEDWHDGTYLDRLLYKSITSGTYQLRIRGCVDGICEEETAQFKIVIDSPIWKKTWFIALIAILIVAVILLAFWFQEQTNKRRKEVLEYSIQMKTKELELKNDHILSSITYAKRIQQAILPKVGSLNRREEEIFLIEMPKDIVGGDFVWYYDDRKGKVFYALCDCTGHGVPGGFMTILSQSFLNSIVHVRNITSPEKILTELNDSIIKGLQENKDTRVQDGLDVALVCLDFNENKIYFSGANRPFVYFNEQNELTVVKGTRRSIGDEYRASRPYKLFEFDFDQVRSIYLYSDGVIDQFGGLGMTKFTSARLFDVLNKIRNKVVSEQETAVREAINLWLESAPFQTDDISFIGIKIK